MQKKITYCTYFNVTYLPKALVLIESLMRVEPHARLVCLCLDDICYGILKQLKLPGVTLLSSTTLESKYRELLKVKNQRPKVEYFWTQSPYLCRFVIDKYNTDIVYVDADLKYFESSARIFEEIGDKSVAICPHWYPTYHDKSGNSGRFNVGWNYFKNDSASRKVLRSWSKDCLSSCAVNNNNCGDQKYLSQWPERFDCVHIMNNQGLDCAPWNFYDYQISQTGNRYFVNGEPLIFFHYHGLNQYRGGIFWPNISYPITYHQLVLYLDYIGDLRRSTKLIKRYLPEFHKYLPKLNPLHELNSFLVSLVVIFKKFGLPAKYAIT